MHQDTVGEQPDLSYSITTGLPPGWPCPYHAQYAQLGAQLPINKSLNHFNIITRPGCNRTPRTVPLGTGSRGGWHVDWHG